jgi:NAD(P)-dependent dehydrogenase (short-subunit alcohol dehydrogenase family)
MDISGKKLVAIGGASGMGRATAEAAAAKGASVAIIDREGSDGAAIAKELGGSFHPAEVTDFAAAEHALQDAVDALGGLHVSVQTAGGGIAARTLGKEGPHDLDAFRGVLDLNVVSTFNMSRLAAAHMAKNELIDGEERGVIINTSSIAAFEGQIGQVAYSAAKAAIAGMSLTMARDLGGLGIRVLAIAPSLFATGAVAGLPDEMIPPLVAGNAFPKRMGKPEEYAKLALAIIDNPMLNGQCLRLDAGMRFAPK